MKFGIVVFPGSNCDEDLFYVYNDILKQDVVKLWHKDRDLQACDFILVPGGFSYGDYLRSGAIARFSPIMDSVIDHANQGGYVLGICNGFQILTEAGLLPGTLLRNIEQKFVCKNAYIRPVSKTALMTATLDHSKAYKIPVAHADGRYYAPNDVIKGLEDNDQILFQYCNDQCAFDDLSNFNGSANAIAGVTNKEKNVFGLMPHPERASDEALGNTDGRALLEALLEKSLV
ncbi:phosphoribosylformylglycinamidine synthase subunit PurQ [Catalinimonas niigatensis]|uniref:phosphoribosylformylglycinamidine synthase subunit PurQ n=1 Tax=Catalinimonas niigatensis TaxID=1397264 RepID=UPI0026662E67|nr:phosphoribosylformylglycinamidine synthase subunit PurQ [Catalinimonas niigatensis]WPP51235.1 phosphoribosylformylglycinamidine synthase subunit PurQ [Catalinimonas niigatensis]